MYLSQTFKLRYGEPADFFICDAFPKNSKRCMKERVMYFLYINGKLTGPYKTHRNCNEVGSAFELIELLHYNYVLVIEPRQVAQEVLQQKLYLRSASVNDLERNTLYFEHQNKNLLGPFVMQTDLCEFDDHLIRKIQADKIFIINERQQLER